MDPMRQGRFKETEASQERLPSLSNNSDASMPNAIDFTIQQSSQQVISQTTNNQESTRPLSEKEVKEINDKSAISDTILIDPYKLRKYLFPGKAEVTSNELIELAYQSALFDELKQLRKKNPRYQLSNEASPCFFIKSEDQNMCYRYFLETENNSSSEPMFEKEEIPVANIGSYKNVLNFNKILHNLKRRGDPIIDLPYDPELQSKLIQNFITTHYSEWVDAAKENSHQMHLVRDMNGVKLSNALPPVHSILVDYASGNVYLRYKRGGVKQSGAFKKLRFGVEYETGNKHAWKTSRVEELMLKKMWRYDPKDVQEFGKVIESHPAFNKLDAFLPDIFSLKKSHVTATHLFSCDASDAFIHYNINPFEDKKFVLRLLRGLEFIHKRNWAHCDIKPENILVEIDPETNRAINVVFDDYDTVVKTNREGFCKRITAAYTRPELFREKLPLSTAPLGDLYAFAKTVYTLYKGASVDFSTEEQWLLKENSYNGYQNKVSNEERKFLMLLYREFHPDPTKRSKSVSEFIQKLMDAGFVDESMEKEEDDDQLADEQQTKLNDKAIDSDNKGEETPIETSTSESESE